MKICLIFFILLCTSYFVRREKLDNVNVNALGFMNSNLYIGIYASCRNQIKKDIYKHVIKARLTRCCEKIFIENSNIRSSMFVLLLVNRINKTTKKVVSPEGNVLISITSLSVKLFVLVASILSHTSNIVVSDIDTDADSYLSRFSFFLQIRVSIWQIVLHFLAYWHRHRL